MELNCKLNGATLDAVVPLCISSGTCSAGVYLIINQTSNEPMLLIRQHNQPIRSPGLLLTLALSTSTLGIMVVNPVFAESHTPTRPASSVLKYESAVTGYRALDGSERSGWKRSNDNVGEIGGWRSYANEAYQANQDEADAKKDLEDRAEGASEVQEPAITTPIPNASAKRMDPASVESSNTEMASMMKKSEVQLAERSNSRPLTISYQSAMSAHRLYDDNPPGGWRAANDRVGEIGGWRTYAKDAYEANKRKAQADAASGNSQ